ncbi:hypothetical protein Q2T41_00775 [Maribacter confluentis]|uniref:Uncharacterized protein n=1 Tax=Maribacter confluentis TaxID=1656093 RepID=A0ABT8RJG0_9FLAO|nr:hypothetical protein [Maribacter confluentis]MDO1511195.1 hypothetical protein [Maribacter confluentis]
MISNQNYTLKFTDNTRPLNTWDYCRSHVLAFGYQLVLLRSNLKKRAAILRQLFTLFNI